MIKRLILTAATGMSMAFAVVHPAAAAASFGSYYGSNISMPSGRCLLYVSDMGGQTRRIDVSTPSVSLSPNAWINGSVGTVRWSTRIDVSPDNGASWIVWRGATYQDSGFAISSNGYTTNSFRSLSAPVLVRTDVNAFRVVAKFQFFDRQGRLLPQETPWYNASVSTQWQRYLTNDGGMIWEWKTILSQDGQCVV